MSESGSTPLAADQRLRINEIFLSIQGEGLSVGELTAFVRLTGCPLRCLYCDTAYAFYEGSWLTIREIQRQVDAFSVRHVTVTGGEPLIQKASPDLLKSLCDAGYRVSLETSGERDISGLDTRVSRVVDIKTPGSGEAHRNMWSNLERLAARDQAKFVICDRRDYEWACTVLAEHGLSDRCTVLFSPAMPQQDGRELAEWMLADRVPARFQLQLHKTLWGDVPGR